MRRHLPSITGLRAFEAAARHLSFTRAAIELNLTPTAISHQIKNLEDLLGAALFVRDRNVIHLTSLGADYLHSIAPAIFEICAATDRAADANKQNILRVACLNTYAVKCLIPNLKIFRTSHPDITLRLSTWVSFEHMVRHDYDVGIRYGSGDWPRMHAEKIANEEIFPVCSPMLLRSPPGLRKPENLQAYTIIRTETRILHDDWRLWLERAGTEIKDFPDEIACDSLSASLQAAIDGLGVALARSSVVKGDLATGRLVEPFDIRLSCILEGYYLVASAEAMVLPKVKAFRDWILAGLN